MVGVAMIYQELTLAPDLSVEDNIMLGVEKSRFGLLRRAEQRRLVHQTLAALGHPDLNPKAIAGRLSVGAQQLVEIGRAILLDARVIVFDEPTSSLPNRDVERLFEVIAKLRAAGKAIIYISHFLEEVRRIADRYSVLRDGETAGDGRLQDVSDRDIVSLMVGRSVDELFPQVAHTPGETILELQSMSGMRAAVRSDVSLALRRGRGVWDCGARRSRQDGTFTLRVRLGSGAVGEGDGRGAIATSHSAQADSGWDWAGE